MAALSGALAGDGDVDTMILQDALKQSHIGEAGNAVKGERLISQ